MLMEHEKHTKKGRNGDELREESKPEGHSESHTAQRELEDTKKQLEEANKKLEETQDKLLRAYADFDNAKKRLEREKDERVRFASERLMLGLLPILDNFERALQHTESSGEEPTSSLKDGIGLIKKQMMNFLTQHGITRLESVGKKFDPHFHEAIGHIETYEPPDDTVVEEVEAGYLYGGRLLRPAKVRVSRVKAAEGEGSGEDNQNDLKIPGQE
jgi:molecular chaperone GrpE